MFGMHSKYVRTRDNQIIVFPYGIQHKDFLKFDPVSAGFIYFYKDANMDGGVNCKCYGESVSLGLKADVEKDSALACRLILDMRKIEDNF